MIGSMLDAAIKRVSYKYGSEILFTTARLHLRFTLQMSSTICKFRSSDAS